MEKLASMKMVKNETIDEPDDEHTPDLMFFYSEPLVKKEYN